jgi:hypothetical protein
MQTSKTKRRRGEGHTEYVILTSIVMVCAMVAILTIADSAKMVALERHLCVSCPARLSLEDLEKKKKEYTGDPSKSKELAEINKELEYRAERRRRAVEALNDPDLRAKETELAILPERTSDQEATLEAIRDEKARREKAAADRDALNGMGATPEGLDEDARAVTDEPLVLGPYLPEYQPESYYDPLGIGTIGRWISDSFRIPSGAPLFYDLANYWNSLNFWGFG